MSNEEYEEAKARMEETEKRLDETILELKKAIKEQFWEEKGIDKSKIINWLLIDEGIDFGIEAMRFNKTLEK